MMSNLDLPVRPLLSPSGTAVGPVPIDQRSNWNDPGRINAFVAGVIVALDVIKVGGLGNAGPLIEITRVSS
jgi:hypothetical protein